MADFLLSFDLQGSQWLILLLCSLLIGMAKTGISGMGLMVVPILAHAFGGRPSVGLLLPILIFADLFAVTWYNRHASWKHVLRLIPWALAGILLATFVGKALSDASFNRMLAAVVILGIAILLWQDLSRKQLQVPNHWSFAAVLGLAGGFSTMMGNAAGPVMALYLLSMRLPKNQFIGTGAWFFFIVNLSKVPFHLWSWHTITRESFALNVLMIPAIALGAILGIWLVRMIPEKYYRLLIILSTILSAILLF